MWFTFALLSAITGAVATIARRTHGATSRPIELAWLTQAISIPLSALLLLTSHQSWFTSYDFLLPAVASAAMCSFASVLCFSAYKYSDASVISPLSNLQPIGMLIATFLMFGTKPPLSGLVGILLIVLGIYYASVGGKHNLLRPFTALWQQRGSRAMLGCLIIWSVSTNLDKIALRATSPVFYLLLTQVLIFIFLSFYVAVQPKQLEGIVWKRWWKHMLIIGAFTTVAVLFQMKALTLTSSSYVFAVKRLDTLIIIFFAGVVLHEKHVLKRFQGAALAVAGVVMMYFIR